MDANAVRNEDAVAGLPATRLSQFLPSFADERNKSLSQQIKELESELHKTRIEDDDNKEHLKVLSQHLANVRQQIAFTQTRVTAKSKEVETESHLCQLSQRETARLQTDIALHQKTRKELENRVVSMQKDMIMTTDKLDKFKLKMNFNQEELEQWTILAKQKEDDNIALERYMRQDDAKIKEMTMQIEKASREVMEVRQDLKEEITNTQAAQTELSKAAQDFRKLHAERQELLQQWENVLEAIRKRDAAILEAGNCFALKKAALAQLQVELDKQASTLAQEVDQGAALEKEASLQERNIEHMYKELTTQKEIVLKLDEQLDTIKNTAQKVMHQLQEEQTANGHARSEIEKQGNMISTAQQRYEYLKGQVAAEGHHLTSLQQNLLDLEALRQQDEARAADLEKRIATLTKQQFLAAQDLHVSKQQGQSLSGEISGAQAQSRNLTQQIARLEQQVVRQQEVLYNVDFQLVQMERKVSRAQGERTRDETDELNARIAALNQALGAVAAEHLMLQSQVKKAEDDFARAQRHNHSLDAEKATILDDMSRTELETEAAARAIKGTIKQKEGKLVEADVWRLEARRLRSLLNSKADQVMSLEHRKRALELGMAERRQEIAVQMELMQGESRLLRDEVHRLTLELRERQMALDKLKAKYNTLASKSRPNDGEELHSQAYYIIKAAQEREELQLEANSFRQRIEHTEHECSALQKHLDDLIGINSEMNQHYRFSCVQQTAEEQTSLKQQLGEAYIVLKTKRQEEHDKSQGVEEAQAKLRNLLAEEGHMRRLLEDLTLQKVDVEQQIKQQAEKTKRAVLQVGKLKKQLAASNTNASQSAAAPISEIELDMQLAQVKESTRAMIDHLKTIVAEHPETTIKQQVEKELGVKLSAEASSCTRSNRSSPASSVRSSPSICSSPGARIKGAGSRPTSCSTRPSSSSSMISKASVHSANVSVKNMQLEL